MPKPQACGELVESAEAQVTMNSIALGPEGGQWVSAPAPKLQVEERGKAAPISKKEMGVPIPGKKELIPFFPMAVLR